MELSKSELSGPRRYIRSRALPVGAKPWVLAEVSQKIVLKGEPYIIISPFLQTN